MLPLAPPGPAVPTGHGVPSGLTHAGSAAADGATAIAAAATPARTANDIFFSAMCRVYPHRKDFRAVLTLSADKTKWFGSDDAHSGDQPGAVLGGIGTLQPE